MAQRSGGVGLTLCAAAAVSLMLGAASLGQQAGGAAPIEPGAAIEARNTYDGFKVVTVTPRDLRDERTALAVSETTWYCERHGPEMDLVVSAEGRAALDEAGITYTIRIDDLKALLDAERLQYEQTRANEGAGGVLRGDTYFDTFRTFDEVNARTDLLVASHPGIVTPVSVGTSRFGRAIRGFAVSAPDSPENPRSQRRQVLFNGTQHAREWLGTTTVMWMGHHLIAEYEAGDEHVGQLLRSAEVIFVPVSNPDGYVYTWTNTRLWRKTRVDNGNGTFGVDPNRNWGFQWGGEGASTSPGNDTYRGPSAFSEPETAALRDFMIARPRLDAHIDFHTYAQLVLSPWGYTSDVPPEPAQTVFNRLNGNMVEAIRSVFGTGYVGGPSYTTIYPASGVVPDWAYGAQGILSWTIELRDTGSYGFVAPASAIVPTGQETFAAALTLLDYVALPLRFTFPDGVPAAAEAGEQTSFRVVIDSRRNTLESGTARLLVRLGGAGVFSSVQLTALPAADEFMATLPAGACGDSIEFRFEAQTTSGATATFPVEQAGVLSVPVVKTLYRDACETAAGWTVGAAGDAATTGVWENAVPQATAAQPGGDVSPDGTRCWVTGATAGTGVGSFDVDGGATTLTSPVFSAVDESLPGVGQTILTYWLWYSNDQGSAPAQDPFYVRISNNGGLNWQELETIPATGSTNAWSRREFDLAGVISPTAQMRLRFVADDAGAGSVLEAAIDEIRVQIRGCVQPPVCVADFDGNGSREVPDIFAFLSAWFAGDTRADVDGTPGLGVPDIFAFLSAWFAGC